MESTLYEMLNQIFMIEYSECVQYEHKQFHFHDSYEIFYAKTEMNYVVNNKTFHLNDGDLLILNDTDIHLSLPPLGKIYRRWIVLFDPLFINSISTNNDDILMLFNKRESKFNNYIHLDENERKLFETILNEGLRIIEEDSFQADIKKKLILAKILLFINEKSLKFEKNNNIKDVEDDCVTKCLEYIHSNYMDPISLDDLERNLYLNKDNLNRKFSKKTGMTVYQYILMYRLVQAKSFLRNGESVTNSAFKSGFGNVSNFIRSFNNNESITPGEYKKRWKDIKNI